MGGGGDFSMTFEFQKGDVAHKRKKQQRVNQKRGRGKEGEVFDWLSTVHQKKRVARGVGVASIRRRRVTCALKFQSKTVSLFFFRELDLTDFFSNRSTTVPCQCGGASCTISATARVVSIRWFLAMGSFLLKT